LASQFEDNDEYMSLEMIDFCNNISI